MSSIQVSLVFSFFYFIVKYTDSRKLRITNIDFTSDIAYCIFALSMKKCMLKFVPFRCHSRFCSTCGTKYSIDRTPSTSFKIIHIQHRHCVFTIDSELRHFFLKDRSLLGLPEAVQGVLLRFFHKDDKTENCTPGFILVLHTFGRGLKWNPHIHCLISEGGIGNSGFWSPKAHFNYTYLRNAFRTALLNSMENKISPSFKKVKAKCYLDHKDGFYVYAKLNKCAPKVVSKYIGRYLGRPVITTSRIDNYDGENDSKITLAIAKEKRKIFLSFNRWHDCLLLSFGYDPLNHPCCGETMLFPNYYFHASIKL